MKIIAFIFMALFSTQSLAQPYFGEFGQGPSGEFRDSTPWQEFVLGADFVFKDPNGLEWRTPNGTAVNGASIPPMFWSFIGGPFTGKYLKASVIHDYYVVNRTRTAHDTHRNFYYGMRANNVPSWQAKAMYWAVRTFGEDWSFDKPATQITEEATMMEITSNLDARQLSATVARQSLLEVARNLKTSDGETLRISFGGPVEATLDAIDLDAFQTQRTLALTVPLLIGENASGFEIMKFSMSGLTDSEDLTFDNLPEWPNGRIPTSGGLVAQDFRDIFPSDQLRAYEFILEEPG